MTAEEKLKELKRKGEYLQYIDKDMVIHRLFYDGADLIANLAVERIKDAYEGGRH